MYKINKGFITQKIDKGITIFDSESSTMHTINGVGSYIFQHLKKGLTEKEICDKLEEKYQIDRKRIESDFKDFLKILVKLQIVEKNK